MEVGVGGRGEYPDRLKGCKVLAQEYALDRGVKDKVASGGDAGKVSHRVGESGVDGGGMTHERGKTVLLGESACDGGEA